MTATYHKEYQADQTAMEEMRAQLRLQPPLEFGPEARPAYDQLIGMTPPVAQGTMSVTRSIAYGVVGSCKTESSQKPAPVHPVLTDALRFSCCTASQLRPICFGI